MRVSTDGNASRLAVGGYRRSASFLPSGSPEPEDRTEEVHDAANRAREVILEVSKAVPENLHDLLELGGQPPHERARDRRQRRGRRGPHVVVAVSEAVSLLGGQLPFFWW